MKKLLTGIFAMTMISFSSIAQVQREEVNNSGVNDERRQNRNRISQRHLEQLKLSETQKEQIKAINTDYRTKMQEMIKSEMPAEDRKAQRGAFEKDKNAKILAVLTSDQQAELKVLMAQEPADRKDDTGDFKEKTKEGGVKTKVKSDDEKTKIKVKAD